MSDIKAIWAHDPIGNNEAQIFDYDTSILEEAEQSGIVFIAEHTDGTRTRIAAKDITQPKPATGSYVFVQPSYVDTRMRAAADVFDALAAIANANANPAALAADATTGGETTPIQAFNNALAAFKAVIKGAGNGNA